MKLIKLKSGSQRASHPIPIEFYPNWCGQGGSPELILYDNIGKTYYILHFETPAEYKQLLSHAHIVYSNQESTDV